MVTRIWLTLILVVTSFVASTTNGFASRAEQSLRDSVYVSPTWGFSVRWYDDEWTVNQQTTSDGVDTLWLTDTMGNAVGFEGRAGYAATPGPASTILSPRCRKRRMRATRFATDEFDRPFKIFTHGGHGPCFSSRSRQTIRNQQSITSCTSTAGRSFRRGGLRPLPGSPGKTFSDELPQLDVLNAALPRGAWYGGVYEELKRLVSQTQDSWSPMPVDSIEPWVAAGHTRAPWHSGRLRAGHDDPGRR